MDLQGSEVDPSVADWFKHWEESGTRWLSRSISLFSCLIDLLHMTLSGHPNITHIQYETVDHLITKPQVLICCCSNPLRPFDFLGPDFRDFLSLSYKSLSEVWRWCWAIRPGTHSALQFVQNGWTSFSAENWGKTFLFEPHFVHWGWQICFYSTACSGTSWPSLLFYFSCIYLIAF